MRLRTAVLWLPVLLSLTAVACDDSSTPTEPSATATGSVETFAGTLVAGGSSVYSFAVVSSGTVAITLASVTANRLTPIDVPLRLGLGVPSGTGCQVTDGVEVTPGLTAQLARDLIAGTYCVDLYDVRGLYAGARFSVRIVHS